jgi:hypothetical protein
MGLHVGIFVVWIPAVLVAQRLARGYERRDVWKAVLRGLPVWLQTAGRLLFGYALVNFAVFLLFLAPNKGPATTLNEFRGFSGHWMLFYGAAFGILYSARRVGVLDHERKCLNGHLVSGAAKVCEQCGAPVTS